MLVWLIARQREYLLYIMIVRVSKNRIAAWKSSRDKDKIGDADASHDQTKERLSKREDFKV